MKKSIEEILSHRKDSINADGHLFKMVVNDEVSEKGFNAEQREGKFVMSAESVDRMKDIIRQDGLDTSDFLKNPMALAFHNHSAPIGMWKDVTLVGGRSKRTEGTLVMHPEGTTAAVDEIANLLSVGGLKAASVGFRVREAQFIEDKDGNWTGGIEFLDCDLLECSVVSIPAHPAALLKSAEGNTPLLAETLEYILDTMCEKTAGGLFVRKEYADAYKDMKGNKSSVVVPDDVLEEKIAGAISIDLDTSEAEKKVDSLIERARKGLAQVFGDKPEDEPVKPDWSEHQKGHIKMDTTVKIGVNFVDDLPEKAVADKDFMVGDHITLDDGIVTVTTQSLIAEYKIAGEDDEHYYLDLHKTYEPGIEPPEFVEGSRAMARAKTAKLMAELQASGVIT